MEAPKMTITIQKPSECQLKKITTSEGTILFSENSNLMDVHTLTILSSCGRTVSIETETFKSPFQSAQQNLG